jgi:hypothetical protein
MRLETSSGNGIDNEQGPEITQYDLNWHRHFTRLYLTAQHRTRPSGIYNCHGLTFASRRTCLHTTADLKRIMADDRYEELQQKDVMAGDIVVYFSDSGDANHSGIVTSYDPNHDAAPLVCSKWGRAGEFLHSLHSCPKAYGPNVKFYRCRL